MKTAKRIQVVVKEKQEKEIFVYEVGDVLDVKECHARYRSKTSLDNSSKGLIISVDIVSGGKDGCRALYRMLLNDKYASVVRVHDDEIENAEFLTHVKLDDLFKED